MMPRTAGSAASSSTNRWIASFIRPTYVRRRVRKSDRDRRLCGTSRGLLTGGETGDGVHFKAAFHPDARMFGHVGPDRYDEPIFGGMDTAVADQPVVEYDTRILSIDVSGDAAAVKLAESRFWGQDFIDFFLLSRIDG